MIDTVCYRVVLFNRRRRVVCRRKGVSSYEQLRAVDSVTTPNGEKIVVKLCKIGRGMSKG